MDASCNKTTILFTQSFKEDIKKIQSSGIVDGLRYGEINNIMETQQNIRDYIDKYYPSYIKNRHPDYYSMLICLIVDIDQYHSWEDFTNLFYPNLPYIGEGEYATQKEYKCCCSHHVLSENTTIISYKGNYLAIGDVCILKTSIVSNFKDFKKKKKIQIEKNALSKNVLLWQIQTYKPRSIKRYETYTNLIKQYRYLKNKEYADSHRTCSCGRPCGKFLKCFQCKKEIEDQCSCGKWKQKKFKKCFVCNSQCS